MSSKRKVYRDTKTILEDIEEQLRQQSRKMAEGRVFILWSLGAAVMLVAISAHVSRTTELLAFLGQLTFLYVSGFLIMFAACIWQIKIRRSRNH